MSLSSGLLATETTPSHNVSQHITYQGSVPVVFASTFDSQPSVTNNYRC